LNSEERLIPKNRAVSNIRQLKAFNIFKMYSLSYSSTALLRDLGQWVRSAGEGHVPVPGTRKVYFEAGEVENKKFFYSIHDDSNATMGDTIQVTISPVTGFAIKFMNGISKK